MNVGILLYKVSVMSPVKSTLGSDVPSKGLCTFGGNCGLS